MEPGRERESWASGRVLGGAPSFVVNDTDVEKPWWGWAGWGAHFWNKTEELTDSKNVDQKPYLPGRPL